VARYLTVPGLFPPPGYAHAAVVEAGERLVFAAGAVPLDEAGALVGDGDVEAQTRQVLANLEAALREAGSGLERVLSSTVYVVASAREDLAAVWEIVRGSALSGGPHTSTLLGVASLGYAGQLVEITAVAAAPGESAATGSR
jgi:enamine deaminase RidA (YjgF/YER057c/UK114 family)